jgi:hypothetical protein
MAACWLDPTPERPSNGARERCFMAADAAVMHRAAAARLILSPMGSSGESIDCDAIDPATIPVERHRLRAKTNRLDDIKLVINLRAWLRRERDRMHVVQVPSAQD